MLDDPIVIAPMTSDGVARDALAAVLALLRARLRASDALSRQSVIHGIIELQRN